MFFTILIFTINVVFWIVLFGPLWRFVGKSASYKNFSGEEDVDIIVAVRNEEDNIDQLVQSLSVQSYDNFRIVIVDDYSSDGTKNKVETISKENSRVVYLKNLNPQGKKFALDYAIRKATSDWILLTDADCRPTSEKWIYHMMEKRSPNTDIVLGYAPFTHRTGLLNKFARFETFMTAVQYLSFTLRKIPYMGVGRNLMYRKGIFLEKGGFESHFNVQSGDDDLFVNQAANSGNVAIQIHKDSFVFSDAPQDFWSFIKQKTRHTSTSFNYRFLHKILLGLYAFSHIFIYCSIFLVDVEIWSLCYISRLIIVSAITNTLMQLLDEKRLRNYIPLLDFLMFAYYVFVGFVLIIKPQIKWK